MQIYLGSDHAGYAMKEVLQKHIQTLGHNVVDLGVFDEVNKSDYPDIAQEVGEKVVEDPKSFGILICGTGMGVGMAANKLKGVRAAVAHDETTARLARQHNNANILAMGQRVVGNEVAKSMVNVFLTTEFEGGRHDERVHKITALENV